MEIEKRINSEETVGEKEIKHNNNSEKITIRLLRVKSEKVAYKHREAQLKRIN